MEKKILICGATGFVGINLLRSLSKKFKLLAVYNKKPKFNCKNVTWVKADLRNYNDCLRVTKSVDIVIQAAHLIAFSLCQISLVLLGKYH